MAQATIQPKLARRPLGEMVVDRIWRFFCSVRMAIYEIALLALLVLVGTLRGSSVPQGIADNIPGTATIVEHWYAWDVFHSLPLILLLSLISVAIAICTINRVPGIWKAIDSPTVMTSMGFLRNAQLNARFDTTKSTENVVADLTTSFRKRGYRVLTAHRDDQVHFFADRHRYAKLGTFPFHLALILILVGGIVGARYGFRDNEFVIPEGSTAAIGHGTGLTVGLTDFRDTYRENGQASEYRSDLVIYKNGAPVKEGSITVNNPITYDGVTIYQSSFGQAVSLRISDMSGNVIFEDSIPMGIYKSRLNPDAPAGILEIPPLGASLHVIGPDGNRVNQPELDTLGLRSGELFVQVRPNDLPEGTMPPSSVVALGETIELEGLNIEFLRERQFTLLQVASNPGMPIFWTAAFLLVGGLAVVFYFPHRRVRGIIAANPGEPEAATALLAPLAKRDWSGQRDFHRVCGDIATNIGVQAQIRQQEAPDDDPQDEGVRIGNAP